MPNLDFYAAGNDLLTVLDWIFAGGVCRVFESYSRMDEDLVEFENPQDIADRYPLGELPGTAHEPLLQLVPNDQSDNVRFRRISLIPEKCGGATYRYCLEGWGLIQLYLGGVGPSGFIESHTNHNSEKRARAWEPTYADSFAPVNAWNWKEIEKTSRRLNRHIASLGVLKLGSRPVLPGALELLNSGVQPYCKAFVYKQS